MSDQRPSATAVERAAELERRAWEGTDDVAYCVKWAGIHRLLARLAKGSTRAGEQRD